MSALQGILTLFFYVSFVVSFTSPILTFFFFVPQKNTMFMLRYSPLIVQEKMEWLVYIHQLVHAFVILTFSPFHLCAVLALSPRNTVVV